MPSSRHPRRIVAIVTQMAQAARLGLRIVPRPTVTTFTGPATVPPGSQPDPGPLVARTACGVEIDERYLIVIGDQDYQPYQRDD
jgi:hypothetical protein